MPRSFAEIEEQARQLPPDERARLAELILESLQETSFYRQDDTGIIIFAVAHHAWQPGY